MSNYSKKDAIKKIEYERKRKSFLIWTFRIIILAVVFVFLFLLIISSEPDRNPNNLTLAQIECIGVNYKYYGTDWCKFCQQQKEILGADLAELSYINCDLDKRACVDAGIELYPTAFATNINTREIQKLLGVQQIEDIIEATSCYP